MVKMNMSLLPVKGHYLFFMAAMGPILPFISVIGKQIGVSEVKMGLIMSIIPILFLIAKPIFGFILDYFQSQRKTVFIALVIFTTVIFTLLQFLPATKLLYLHQQTNCSAIPNCLDDLGIPCELVMVDSSVAGGRQVNDTLCATSQLNCSSTQLISANCQPVSSNTPPLYVFWTFVLVLSAGCTGYNVANSISDAVCFDVLGGGNEKNYGAQRVWGTVGFGLSALLGGFCVDWWSGPSPVKDYSPAFLIALLCTSLDLFCCFKLKLPALPKSSNIMTDVVNLVRNPSIATFLLFAAFVGICESFIIFFLFWHLEELALAAGMMNNIKLLQGLTVAAETLIGEIIFFPLSGRILKALGYQHCLSLCFLVYAARLGLLSLITDPWWVLPVELLQGPSYALSYTTIVAYASAISPPGTSATMQGIAAGVDDGLGYSVGSFIGGFMYKYLGGSLSFRVFSAFAFICSLVHWLLSILIFREASTSSTPTAAFPQSKEKRDIYNPPKQAAELVVSPTCS